MYKAADDERDGHEDYSGCSDAWEPAAPVVAGLVIDSVFYEELEPRLIDKTFLMLDSPRAEVRKFAAQILNGLVQRGRIQPEELPAVLARTIREIGARK